MFTVATNETDGYKRFIRSTEVNDFRDKVNVIGLGKKWTGGNVRKYVGGGQKVNLLKEAIEKYKDDENTIIIFTDRCVFEKAIIQNKV